MSAVINSWLDNGQPIGAVAKKSDWKTAEFSKPVKIHAGYRFNEKNYSRLRFGLLPEEMEDKWFAYFEDNRLCFHRSWTGYKIYEAEVQRSDAYIEIKELMVERDNKFYSNTDDAEDVRLFNFLVGQGLLGLNIDASVDFGDDNSI